MYAHRWWRWKAGEGGGRDRIRVLANVLQQRIEILY